MIHTIHDGPANHRAGADGWVSDKGIRMIGPLGIFLRPRETLPSSSIEYGEDESGCCKPVCISGRGMLCCHEIKDGVLFGVALV